MTPADPFRLLDRLSVLHLVRAVGAGPDDLARRLGALPRHARLVAALADILATAPAPGDIAAERTSLLEAHPDLAPHVALLEACAADLPAILRGERQATDVLFPGGRMDRVEPIYRGSRWTDHFNGLVADAVSRAAIGLAASGRPARVLEIGAGTGGTSAGVVERLSACGAAVEYHYTDVSPAFVQHGRQRFGQAPFVRFAPLDIERDPGAQGFAPGGFDVVVATNVLHATADMAATLDRVRGLLAEGGLLLLNEVTRADAFGTLTFGLLDGWWRFTDAAHRLPHSPLLDAARWRRVLAGAGFGRVKAFPWGDDEGDTFSCLFAAEAGAIPASGAVGASLPVVTACAARVLGFAESELAFDRPFVEMGVDSIVAPQLAAAVSEALGVPVDAADLYNHSTLAALAAHLDRQAPAGPVEVPAPPPSPDDIAVIGLACRFPGAPDADAFWRLLVEGRSAVTEVPAGRWDWRAVDGINSHWGAFLDAHDRFDPEFFHLSWNDAEAMSPQQRVFLECAWHALEDAALAPRTLAGARCGVFVGVAPDYYEEDRADAPSSLGGSNAILAARLAYILDLKGPAVPVDTACSSSLVALHLACQAVRGGECEVAVAGGVSILMDGPRLHRFLSDAGMASPTGQCRAFAAEADGFVPGEGVGAVVLKPLARALAEGDRVLAVIKGSGTNQDGRSSGITAPSGPAQTELELDVWRRFGIDAARFGLIEAHGTGTPLGDPIEANALTAAIRRHTDKRAYCALGSVKTNVGHTLAAAGVAGVIKAVLALRHGVIPPSLGWAAPNPRIDFAAAPFTVPTEARPWTCDGPRLAAVNSFGFSGTNAHVVIEEAPPVPVVPPAAADRLVLVSARSPEALEQRWRDLADWLAAHPDAPFAAVAFSATAGRGHFEYRSAFRARDGRTLAALLAQAQVSGPVRPNEPEPSRRLAALHPASDLDAVAEAYLAGGDGAFEDLFPASERRRIGLPGTPFADLRFRRQSSQATRLNLPPTLADHRRDGRPLLPAVAVLDALRQRRGCVRLENVRWPRPLFLDGSPVAHLHADGDAFSLTCDGVTHAEGRVRDAGTSPPAVDVAALARRMTRQWDAAEVYAALARTGFDYGPAFRPITRLSTAGDEALARLEGNDPVALLDGAVQAAVGLALDAAPGSILPVGLAVAELYDDPALGRWAHVERRPGAPERVVLTIRLLAEDGRVVALLDGLEARVGQAVRFYRPIWTPAEAPAAADAPILLFDSGLERWRAAGPDAVLVQAGQGFANPQPRHFVIDPARPGDWAALVQALGPGAPGRALLLWGLDRPPLDWFAEAPDALAARVEDVSAAVLRLVRAWNGPLTVLHAHRGEGEPEDAAVAGLARALDAEGASVSVRCVGIEGDDPLAVLRRELAADDSAVEVLWRENQRFRRGFEPVTEAPAVPRPASVWLLTGGFGGVGRLVARHLAGQGARLVLVGRHGDAAFVAELERLGADVLAVAADLSRPDDARRVVAEARRRFGRIDAVAHLAAVLRDALVKATTDDDFNAVLAPKVWGLLALERALADDPPETVVAFSSVASAVGNAGQGAYGAANRMLDALAARRPGMVSIGWGFWRDGGMAARDGDDSALAAATGARWLDTAAALAAFDRATGVGEPWLLALAGDADRLGTALSAPRRRPAPVPVNAPVSDVRARLLRLVSDVIGMPAERLRTDRPIEQYGIDSLRITQINEALERDMGVASKTLFFEHDTLDGVAGALAHLVPQPAAQPEPAPSSGGAIAVIGMSGRYPMAEDLDAYWRNLASGRNCVSEVPAERWDMARWFDPTPGTPGRTYSRWGGFLPGVDQFDPLFFNIAPGDAERMDPQERLFLEVAWEAMEDGGLKRGAFGSAGRDVGVFVGVMYGDFQLVAAEEHLKGNPINAASPYWSIPNRVSYALDLTGPSLAVDSACSSSLTALHLACRALAAGDCRAAIVGGVNLNLHPLKYVGLSQGRFASTDGRCRSFGEGGDGYVPGEGVGAVILKPLAAALADGDVIHGVILGSAVNHGGKTQGYTVPSPRAQASVIGAALAGAGVRPRDLSYVEAHGTGTALGDPIEIAGLSGALAEDGDAQWCPLGTVKAGIGHLEAAAGIAGLTKILLQFRHRRLAPTLTFGPTNPGIDFAASPFRLVTEAEDWAVENPVAGISSFGAGGANAHVVLAAPPERGVARAAENGPFLFVVSGRSEAQVRASAARLADHFRTARPAAADAAYTLRVGRDALDARLAFLADNIDVAADRLAAFAEGDAAGCWFGVLDDAPPPAVPGGAGLAALGQAWVAGAAVEWPAEGRRIALPARPFLRRRLWPKLTEAAGGLSLRPLPSLDGARFALGLHAGIACLGDHRVGGQILVPGAMLFSVAKEAADALGLDMGGLRDVAWRVPLAVPDSGGVEAVLVVERDLRVRLEHDGTVIAEARLDASAGVPDAVDLAGLRRGREVDGASLYADLGALGLEYGPSLRLVRRLWVGDGGALAELAPAGSDSAWPTEVFDAALHTLGALVLDQADGEARLPARLEHLAVHGDPAAARWALARRDGAILLLDAAGTAVATLSGLDVGAARRPGPVLLHPVWREEAAEPCPETGPLVVTHTDGAGEWPDGTPVVCLRALPESVLAETLRQMPAPPRVVFVAPEPAGASASGAEDACLALLTLGRVLADVAAASLTVVTRGRDVLPGEVPDPVADALVGLAKGIARDLPLPVRLLDRPETLDGEPAELPAAEVAWRDGRRLVRRLAPLDAPPETAGWSSLPDRAVCLIVGGGGGLGLTLARHLAGLKKARVALVGRRPAGPEVAGVLADLAAVGGEGLYLQADATDAPALAAAVDAVQARWGTPDLVVCAALVLADRPLARMDDAAFRLAFAPKAQGAEALVAALRGRWPGMLAFFSSANVLAGTPGQVNYVAGAAFQDTLARRLAAEGLPAVAIDWGLWGEVGAVKDARFQDRLAREGIHPITPAEGMAAFARLLAAGVPQAAAVKASAEALHGLGLRAADPLAEALFRTAARFDLSGEAAAFAALEAYGRARLLAALPLAPGKAYTTEGLRRAVGLVDRHRALFDALIALLAADGLLVQADNLWRVSPEDRLAEATDHLDRALAAHPWLGGPRALLDACLDAYPALLRGEADPLAVMFPGGSGRLVESAYAGAPVPDAYNVLAAAGLAAGAPRKVLEVGAGTGGGSVAALAALGHIEDYCYTDVSAALVAQAAKRFGGDRPWMRFRPWNLETDPPADLGNGFDAVLAVNVLHATADLPGVLARLRGLLRPGGALVINEITAPQDYATLVFGLTEGWWSGAGQAGRIPGGPLLNPEDWRAALAAAGFASVVVQAVPGVASQSVLVAVAPQVVAPRPAAPAGDRPQVLAYLRGVMAEVLKLEPAEIRASDSFDRYGLESLAAMEIRDRLDRDLGAVSPTLLFEYNSLNALADHLMERHGAAFAQPEPDPEPLASPENEPIAIIGLACRFPGGDDPDSFWRLLESGGSAIRPLPAERGWPGSVFGAGDGQAYTAWGGFLDEIDQFDPLFFGISPLEAAGMDPQERLVLETAWRCIEDAGYAPSRLSARMPSGAGGADVGVFVGVMNAGYQWHAVEAWRDGAADAVSTAFWSAANRVSWHLDLRGPSMVVDTACSSSLSAVHMACESLRSGACRAALAGGVNLIVHPRQMVNLCQAGMLSAGSENRAFAEGADGFVDGEGVGMVLLKPLSAALADGDRIEALILGGATNSGGRTSGFSVPNPQAQAAVVQAALGRAGVAPDGIGFVETHGTGTRLGDPIEVNGLSRALAGAAPGSIPLGALKANIGHLESASGIASVIKVVQQLRHRTIAPHPHADNPNPLIDFKATPFRLPAEATPWGERRRAGISAFGAGGSNVHLIMAEAPAAVTGSVASGPQLIVLSAADPMRLRAEAAALLDVVAGVPLADVAHTLRVGRAPLIERAAFVAADMPALLAGLRAVAEDRAMPGLHRGRAGADVEADVRGADLDRLAALWVAGADLDFEPMGQGARPVRLPGHAFARERCWLPLQTSFFLKNEKGFGVHPERVRAAARLSDGSGQVPGLSQPVVRWLERLWQPAPPCVAPAVPPHRWAVVGDPSLAAALGAATTPEGAAILVHVAGPDTDGLLALPGLMRAAGAATIVHVVPAATPAAEAAAAFAASAAQEMESPRLVVVEADDRPPAALAATLRAGWPAGQGRLRLTPGGALAPVLAPFEPPPAAVPFRAGGRYLLVGGLGEVGSALAERLLTRYGARLGILSRTQPKANPLAGLGEVWHEACDITDALALAAAVDRLRGRLGGFDGVLHLARAVEDGAILGKTEAAMRRVLAAKVEGTANLDRVLAGDRLDFFVLFSSLAAWLGLPGGADYAAACAWQDGFAAWRVGEVAAGRRFGTTVAVGWPQWRFDRHLDAAKEQRLAEAGLSLLDADGGLDLIGAALGSGRAAVGAVLGDAEAVDAVLAAPPPDELEALSDDDLAAYVAHLRDSIPVLPARGASALVADIRSVIADHLRIAEDRIADDTRLADLGLDSIKALHIANKLAARTGHGVEAAMLYRHPTLSALAAALTEAAQ